MRYKEYLNCVCSCWETIGTGNEGVYYFFCGVRISEKSFIKLENEKDETARN